MIAGTLRRDERGEDIERMQRWLNQAGYPVLVDGVYGPRSQAAVAAFLGDQGQEGDGSELDERRVTLLKAVASNPSLRPKTVSKPRRRASTIAPTAAAIKAADLRELDALGVEVEARAFARILCSKRTSTPLSIGLFGDWGAGKSYFMSTLRQQIEARGRAYERVAKALEEDGDDDQLHAMEELWHSRVAQITFNAWHFAEPNLWASLVTSIFDQMAGLLNPEESLADTRARLLAEVSEGKQRREQAELELHEAEGVLSEARAEANERERELEELREELAVVEAAAPVVGEDGEAGRTVLKVQGPIAALRVAWRWVWSQGKWTRRGIIAGAILLVLGIVLGILVWRELITLEPAIALGTACAGVITGVTSTLVAYWAIVQPLLAKAQAGYLAATQGSAAVGSFLDRAARDLLKPGTSALEVARRRVASAEAGVDSANAASTAASEQVSRARAMLQDLTGGQRFYAFIRDRGESDDYRQHLGLVSAIREDFDQLEEIMRQVEHEGAGDDQAPPPITRIVLYIDDLDRCEPARVVEVLQAVHLLLATPIFAVVLAVDVRWLHQSLSLYYDRMLGPQEDAEDGADDDRPSPQSYLEKVFQVPFSLRPMGSEGFGALVEKVLDPGMPDEPLRPTVGGGTVQQAPSEASDEPETDDQPEAPKAPKAPVVPRPKDEELRELTNDAALELAPAEITFAKSMHSVIGTPRLGKALINSYRVMRAELATELIDEYLADGTYRGVLTLLAIRVGRSADAPILFEALAFATEGTIGEVVAKQATDTTSDAREERWRQLAAALEGAGVETIPVADLRPWLVRVRRFSFDPWPSQSF